MEAQRNYQKMLKPLYPFVTLGRQKNIAGAPEYNYVSPHQMNVLQGNWQNNLSTRALGEI